MDVSYKQVVTRQSRAPRSLSGKARGFIERLLQAVEFSWGDVSGWSADKDAKRVPGRVGVDPQRLLRVI